MHTVGKSSGCLRGRGRAWLYVHWEICIRTGRRTREGTRRAHHKMKFLRLTWMPKAARFGLRKTFLIRLWGRQPPGRYRLVIKLFSRLMSPRTALAPSHSMSWTGFSKRLLRPPPRPWWLRSQEAGAGKGRSKQVSVRLALAPRPSL